ncbi:TPA: hypothetical protein ACMGHF_000535 [Legionella pneumophila]|nr:hypothetical protein [Legionella pneumophila]
MFSTMDSCPQDIMENNATQTHVLCLCVFNNPEHALSWINKLIPKNKNNTFIKWASQRGARRELIRERFKNNMLGNLDKLDFKIYCVISNESDISYITQSYYLNNLHYISQELNDNKKNCLIFNLPENNKIKLHVLKAGRIIWAFHVLHMLHDQFGISGIIHSDWLAQDSMTTRIPAEGASLINFLLSYTKTELTLKLPKDPKDQTYELMSDWVAGWCKEFIDNNEEDEQFSRLINSESPKIIKLDFKPSFGKIFYGRPFFLHTYDAKNKIHRFFINYLAW